MAGCRLPYLPVIFSQCEIAIGKSLESAGAVEPCRGNETRHIPADNVAKKGLALPHQAGGGGAAYPEELTLASRHVAGLEASSPCIVRTAVAMVPAVQEYLCTPVGPVSQAAGEGGAGYDRRFSPIVRDDQKGDPVLWCMAAEMIAQSIDRAFIARADIMDTEQQMPLARYGRRSIEMPTIQTRSSHRFAVRRCGPSQPQSRIRKFKILIADCGHRRLMPSQRQSKIAGLD